MEVINCKGCGKLFNSITRKRLCPNCVNQLEEKFQEVKRFLNENPNSTMEMLSQECDVSVKQIKDWVREERLIFTADSADGIVCEKCGKTILTGRYCEDCKLKMQNNLKTGIDKRERSDRKKNRTKDRMRFL